MTDDIDWSLVTWEGNRRHQSDAVQRLTFRERIEQIEEMERVADVLCPPSTTGRTQRTPPREAKTE